MLLTHFFFKREGSVKQKKGGVIRIGAVHCKANQKGPREDPDIWKQPFSWGTQSMEGSEKHRRREGWRHHFTPALVQTAYLPPAGASQRLSKGLFRKIEGGEREGTCKHVMHPNWSPSVGAMQKKQKQG